LALAVKKIEMDLGFPAIVQEELPRSLKDKRTQGVAARIHAFPLRRFSKEIEALKEAFQSPGQWAILDRVQDPQNYGAILRSAAAFGLKGIFVGLKESCPMTGTVAQVSAGNFFKVPVYEVPNSNRLIELVVEAGGQVASLDAGGEPLGASVMEKAAGGALLWVLGAEHKGVASRFLDKSTMTVRIPMAEGVESLNVSNAAAVAFYEGQKIFNLD